MHNTLKRIRSNKLFRQAKKIRSLCKTLFWFFFRITTRKRGVKVNIGNTGNFRLDCTFMFSNYEMWGRNHNDGFGRLLEICREKQTVLDIGAHIGLCALPVSKIIHGSGTVIAFEPGDANFRYLQRHIQFNQAQNIEAFPFLVGEESRDEVPFYESPAPTGMNSIVRYKELASADWVTRKQVCLDDFCREHQIAPEVIKIDVEGAEIGVLRGMRETLKTCRPSIILSVHPRHLELLGESEDILLDTLKELNYSISDMSGYEVNTFELKEYILEPAQTGVLTP